MASIALHKKHIEEHREEIDEAIDKGIEKRPTTIGFHTSACAVEMLELYLHKKNIITTGKTVKHNWFERPKAEQKIKPLIERRLDVDFFGISDYGAESCTASTYSDYTTVTIELDSDLGVGETVSDTALLTTDPRLVRKIERGDIADGFWTNTHIIADYDEAGGTGDISESDETDNEYEVYITVTT